MNRGPKRQVQWLVLLSVVFLAFYLFAVRPESDLAPFSEPVVARAEVAVPLIEDDQENQDDDQAVDVTPEAISTDVELARDRAFISHAFPLLSIWDPAVVRPLLSEETAAANSDKELNEVMTVLGNRLGKLDYFETPELMDLVDAEQPVPGDAKLQQYYFIAHYEAGAAEVNLVLYHEPDASSLYSFNINVAK